MAIKARHKTISILLLLLLVIVAFFSVRYGAIYIHTDEIFGAMNKWIYHTENYTLNERIFLYIRLPRAILCIFVGASLAVGGVLMQALFRNPIVEPGLVGTSAGAAFGASIYFVLGATFSINLGEWALPISACIGAILATALVFIFSKSKQHGKSTIISLLLTGIAVNALFLSGVGFLSYIARDPQARSITFWNLGTLSGANWHTVSIIGFTTLIGIILSLRFAKHLNALMLGETESRFLGIRINQLKIYILLLNIMMVATATAFVGIIGFVGLIIPNILRTLSGSDNRILIRNAALLGGILLSLADLFSRVILRPAELPIGIVTSIVGVPIFIYLLRKKNYIF